MRDARSQPYALEGIVERALGSAPLLAFIEGPTGIGKSRSPAATREKCDAAGFVFAPPDDGGALGDGIIQRAR